MDDVSIDLCRLLDNGFIVEVSKNVLRTYTACCWRKYTQTRKGIFGTFASDGETLTKTDEGKPRQHATAETPAAAIKQLVAQMHDGEKPKMF